MKTATLKPGLLVSLKTSITGGVHYTHSSHVSKDDGDAHVEEWQTTKVVTDADEVADATKLRGKASALVRGVCSYSAFGLLCPIDKEADLDAAIAEASKLAQDFNKNAKTVRVDVYALKGRIAESDVEAAKAIGSEIRELLDEMKAGLAAADVPKIRDAANRARKLGEMLDPTVAEKVSAAIEGAREAARNMVKQIAAGAERAAVAVAAVQEVEDARFAFLDIIEGGGDVGGAAPAGEALPAVDPRALDIDPPGRPIEQPPREQMPLALAGEVR